MHTARFALHWRRYARRFRQPLRTASGVWERREGLLLRLEGAQGEGFGEIAPWPEGGSESLEDALSWLNTLRHHWSPQTDLPPAQLGATAFALGCARLGALGQSLAKPRRNKMAVCALFDLRAADAPATAAHLASTGWTRLKAKISGKDPAADMAAVAAVVKALPAGTQLRLDANGSLDFHTADSWLRSFAPGVLEYLEQPLPPWDREGLSQLAAVHPGRVALEESIPSSAAAQAWAARGWRGPVVVKPSLRGDPQAWLASAAQAPWPWVFSTAFETAVGAADALKVAFSSREPAQAVGFGADRMMTPDGLGPRWSGPWVEWADLANEQPRRIWDLL